MVILVLVVAQILPNCTVIISALLQSGQIIIDLFRGVAASIRNIKIIKSRSHSSRKYSKSVKNQWQRWLKISQNGKWTIAKSPLQLQLASTRQITAALQHLQRPAEDFIEILEPQFVVRDNTWHFRSVWAFLRFSVVINSGGRNAPTHGAFRRRVTIVPSKNNFIRLDISTRHCINGGYQLCATK